MAVINLAFKLEMFLTSLMHLGATILIIVLTKNSGCCLERHTGSHSENRDKATPSKPVRKSSKQNILRNLNHVNRRVRKHRKRSSYTLAMRALVEGRDNNPAHKEFFNSLISDLKKKNTHVIGRQLMVEIQLQGYSL